MGRSVRISSLTTREPFADIFPVEPEKVEAIRSHMRLEGFDEGAPIIVWPEGGRLTVVDGHTRLQAAFGVPLAEVYTFEHEFADEDAAFAYAIHNQRDRRNLSAEDLIRIIAHVDTRFRKRLGGERNPEGINQYSEVSGSREPLTSPIVSAEQTAKVVGTSPSTVKRARAILADPVATEAVQAGMPIAKAAEAAYARKRGEAVSFPPTNGASMPLHDDEPWFKAKAAGSIAASTLRIAIREIRELIAQLEREGISVAELMGDRRVSGAWSATADNGALRRANELAALIRGAIRG